MPNERSSVRVAFDAMAFHQQDVALRHLAETVPAICRHGRNDAFENQAIVRQAAHAKERRLWRR